MAQFECKHWVGGGITLTSNLLSSCPPLLWLSFGCQGCVLVPGFVICPASCSLSLDPSIWHCDTQWDWGGTGEGNRNPVTHEGARADSAGDKVSVWAQLSCPLEVFGEAKEGVRWAGCRPCNQEQRWERAQHSPRKLEGDGAARVVGEEFIYKPADGLAITSLHVCGVTAGCHREHFMEQNSLCTHSDII